MYYMKAFVSTLLLGAAVAFQAQAQDEVFKVLASRGNITSNKTAVTAGKKLYKDEIVEVSGSGFVGLVHKSGKTLELKTPGSYPINDLAAKIGGSGSSVSERYANYVIQEVSKDKEGSVKKNHQQYMAVTGAVTRATNVVNQEVEVVALVPAQTDVLASSTATTFHWHRVPHAKSYSVHITNMGEDVLFHKEVTDTSATIDFSKIVLGKAKMCLWTVTAKTAHGKEHKSEKHGLQLIPAGKATEISTEVASLKADSDPKSSLSKIMLAAYYEDHNMYVDAINAYQEALKMEHNDDYNAMYANCLYRAGLAEQGAK